MAVNMSRERHFWHTRRRGGASPAMVLAAPDPELCPASSAVGGGVVRHPQGGPGLPLVHLLPAELRGAATVLAPAPRGLPAAGTVQPKLLTHTGVSRSVTRAISRTQHTRTHTRFTPPQS